jgi:hypothetical protein
MPEQTISSLDVSVGSEDLLCNSISLMLVGSFPSGYPEQVLKSTVCCTM